MPKPDVHPMECACRACTPAKLNGGAEALGLSAAALILVAIVLLAVAAGLHLESLAHWE
jgi:hypothetical protein